MIAFASRTGNVRHICGCFNLPNIEINKGLLINKPFLLLTYTDGMGAVPHQVEHFMQMNHERCVGIVVSGNRNFGQNFGAAGDKLARQYAIPLICKMDLRGQKQDFVRIEQFIRDLFT